MKAILTRYRGPTDTRGGRILASDMDGNRTSIPYPHSLSSDDGHFRAAVALCHKMGWQGELAGGYTREGMAWVWIADRDANIRKVQP